jgi:hypothetical protein
MADKCSEANHLRLTNFIASDMALAGSETRELLFQAGLLFRLCLRFQE